MKKELLLFCFMAASLVQFSTCDAPVWHVGDYWVWEVTEPGWGKSREVFLSEEMETNLLKSVVRGKEFMEGEECYHNFETYEGHPESEYHSYYLVSCPPTEHHGIEYSTETGNPVMKSTIYPGNFIVQFPMDLGKTWEGEYKFVEWTRDENTDTWVQSTEISVKIEAEVTSIESVEVEAGIFNTYRIEMMYYTFKMLKSVVWYSPEVKNTVKGEAYVYEDKVPQLYYEFELVEYDLVTSFPWELLLVGGAIVAGVVAIVVTLYKKRAKTDKEVIT